VLEDSSTQFDGTVKSENGATEGCSVRWKLQQGNSGIFFQATTKVIPAPQTGEISSCTINVRHMTDNPLVVFTMLHGMYPNVLAFPDSGLGRLLQALVQHEMGHCLGLNHYVREGKYPADSLRNPDFVARNGHVPSVMSYQFINRVALPDDGIPLDDMVMKIGPHDRWLIKLLYTPIPGATTPADELPTLTQWRLEQDSALYVRMLEPELHMTSLGDDAINRASYTIQRLANMVHLFNGRDDMEGPPIDAKRTPENLGVWQGSKVSEGEQSLFSPLAIAKEWMHELNSIIAVIGGSSARHPYPRNQRQLESVAFDSASQVHAVHEIITRMLYGDDPFLRAVFQETRRDTLLMVFSPIPVAWDSVQWRDQQLQTLGLLVDQIAIVTKRYPNLRKKICRIFEEARQRVELYMRTNEPSDGSAHVRALLEILSSRTPDKTTYCAGSPQSVP
jgi:hypothetical protein